jgi:hypothetical protein
MADLFDAPYFVEAVLLLLAVVGIAAIRRSGRTGNLRTLD